MQATALSQASYVLWHEMGRRGSEAEQTDCRGVSLSLHPKILWASVLPELSEAKISIRKAKRRRFLHGGWEGLPEQQE